jgi:hypothetical protein
VEVESVVVECQPGEESCPICRDGYEESGEEDWITVEGSDDEVEAESEGIGGRRPDLEELLDEADEEQNDQEPV